MRGSTSRSRLHRGIIGSVELPFDPPALQAFSADNQAVWHLRHYPQEGLEVRARATLADQLWTVRSRTCPP